LLNKLKAGRERVDRVNKRQCRVCDAERDFEEIGVPSWGQSFERRIALTSGGKFGYLNACVECGTTVFMEGKTGLEPV
jgi:hypothetical protein